MRMKQALIDLHAERMHGMTSKLGGAEVGLAISFAIRQMRSASLRNPHPRMQLSGVRCRAPEGVPAAVHQDSETGAPLRDDAPTVRPYSPWRAFGLALEKHGILSEIERRDARLDAVLDQVRLVGCRVDQAHLGLADRLPNIEPSLRTARLAEAQEKTGAWQRHVRALHAAGHGAVED